MTRAIDLASRTLGRTSPNPIVGCVILDAAGAVVGEGYHARAGGPHAEVVALAAAGGRAAGGTAVVTLEPCAHTGRTGACTAALDAAGIRRVVYAVGDPDPVAAGGAEVLSAAGLDVEGGLLADAAARGNEAWLLAVRLGRPYVTWKYAATLDGRTAASDGTSQWITSAAARADGHRLRAQVDAVIAGTGTVLADDPHLTARDPDGALVDRQPLRVVVGCRPIPPAARVLDDAAPTLLLATRDLRAVLGTLYDRDARHVLVEGGATLAGAFVRAGLVDRVIGYLAPALLGAGATALGDAGIGTIAHALRLRLDDVSRIGPDVRLTARAANSTGHPTARANANSTARVHEAEEA